MQNPVYDRTLAFAGICQGAKLVQQIARTGQCDEQAYHTSINAIVNINPSSTLDVFGCESGLRTGFQAFTSGFSDQDSGRELMRYVINLLALERKLSSNKNAMAQLGERINNTERQRLHYDLFSEHMLSNLASIYLDIISPIGPRIQIAGNPSVLQQTSSQQKIRALLLSSIRCAVLWHQVGGKRRHLVFNRKKMLQQAHILLSKC